MALMGATASGCQVLLVDHRLRRLLLWLGLRGLRAPLLFECRLEFRRAGSMSCQHNISY